VLAATLEHMIHSEAVGRLEATFRLLGKAPEDSLSQADATWVLETYMQAYVLGYNVSMLTRRQVEVMNRKVADAFPPWPKLRDFLHQVQGEVFAGLGRFSLADITRVAEAVSEHYGSFQDSEDCEDMRSRLIKLEEASGTGRVRLVDFYESSMKHGNWQFREHPELLKQMGVLDDSDPSVPRVVIPNYVNTPSNCLNPASAFYSICCMDRCEELMDHLESKIQNPFAKPEEIVGLVSAFPSTSVSAPRTLPQALVQKLQEVATQHDGLVPLHSRLFAQWLHFAYPRECQYPHISSTTLNMTAEGWSATTGLGVALSEAEIQSYVENQRTASRKLAVSEPAVGDSGEESDKALCSAMWTTDEELIDVEAWRAAHRERRLGEAGFSLRSLLRAAAMVGAAVSMILVLKEQLFHASGHKKDIVSV
jgi:hypothetical protein